MGEERMRITTKPRFHHLKFVGGTLRIVCFETVTRRNVSLLCCFGPILPILVRIENDSECQTQPFCDKQQILANLQARSWILIWINTKD